MIADEIIEPRSFLEVYTIVTKLILTGSRLTVKRSNYNAPTNQNKTTAVDIRAVNQQITWLNLGKSLQKYTDI